MAKIKANANDNEEQIREKLINGISPENYLEVEKFAPDISSQELVESLCVLEYKCKTEYTKAEPIEIMINGCKNGVTLKANYYQNFINFI